MAKRRNINERRDISRYMEELAAREQRIRMPSAAITETDIELSRVAQERRELQRAYPSGTSEEYTKKSEQLDRRTKRIEAERAQIQERREDDASRLFQNRIMSMTRPERLETETRVMASSSSAALGAMRMSNARMDTDIERDISRNRRAQTRVSEQLREAARGIDQPGGREQFEKLANVLEDIKGRGAEMIGARDIQRRERRDLPGQLRTMGEISSEIEARRYSADIRGQVASGTVGSMKSEVQKLTGLEDTFLKLKKAIEEATDTTSDSFKELREQATEAGESFRKQKDIVDEMNRQGMGGGRKGIDTARNVLGILSAGTDVAKYGFIQSNMDKLAVQTQLANQINAESFDVMSATQGNMAAMRRISSNTYGANRAGGLELGSRMGAIQTAEAAAQLGDAVTRGLASTSDASIGAVFSGGTATVAKAANEAAPSAAAAAKTGINLTKGIDVAQTQVSRTALGVGLEDAINAVPDAAMQAAFDFRMRARRSTIGMGGARGAVYDQVISADQMKAMAGFGIDIERQSDLAGLATREMGAKFLRGGTGVLRSAGRAEAAGIMGAESFIAQAGALTNVGGGQKNLEEIMANAVARGVDNAKAISGLTTSIIGLASSSAARGIDVSMGATRQMLQGVEGLSRTGLSEEMKQAAAAGGLAKLNQVTSGTSLNLATMLERQAISNMGLSQVQQINFQRMSATQVSQMQNLAESGDIQGLKDFEMMTGLSGKIVDQSGNIDKKFINQAVSAKVAKIRGGVGGVLGSSAANAEKEAYLRGDISIDKMSTEARDLLAMEGLTGVSAAFKAGPASGKSPNLRTDSSELGAAQRAAVTGATGQVEQISQAVQMGGGPNFMTGVSQKLDRILGELDINKQGAAAAKSAEQMSLDTGKFNEGVSDFKEAAKLLRESIKENAAAVSVKEYAQKLGEALIDAVKNSKNDAKLPVIPRGLK